ncbi:MAG: hypothetical protein FWD27_00575 [Coriobacteriia bacterium]|nr:hypothetical protein [Coriobacteriia bacterium]
MRPIDRDRLLRHVDSELSSEHEESEWDKGYNDALNNVRMLIEYGNLDLGTCETCKRAQKRFEQRDRCERTDIYCTSIKYCGLWEEH